MIFPWHTDLSQPGRTVCVVFRASPLIWPTSFGAHHAPRPLYKAHPRWFFLDGAIWRASAPKLVLKFDKRSC